MNGLRAKSELSRVQIWKKKCVECVYPHPRVNTRNKEGKNPVVPGRARARKTRAWGEWRGGAEGRGARGEGRGGKREEGVRRLESGKAGVKK
jgi:hypothetical protein